MSEIGAVNAVEVLLPMHPAVNRAMVTDWGERASALGVDRVWVAELRSGDPFALVMQLQHAAPGLATGTCIASLYGRSVRSLAAATVVVADGHDFILGVGVSNRAIAGWHERAWESPQRAVPDAIAGLRRLLAGDKGEHGPSVFWQGSGNREVPLHLAGVSVKGIALASSCADGLLLNLVPPGDALDQAVARFATPARPDRPVRCVVRVTPHHEPPSTGWQEWLEKEIGGYAGASGYREVLGATGSRVLPTQVAMGAEAWSRLAQEYRAAGVTPVALPLLAPWENPAQLVVGVLDLVARTSR